MNIRYLDFNTRGNGKTFHYLRIMAYHGIPLIVHNLDYRENLVRDFNHCLKETAFIDEPKIYSIQDRYLYLHIGGIKSIIDDPIALQNDKCDWYKKLDWYSDDEIIEIIHEDRRLGASWMYDK